MRANAWLYPVAEIVHILGFTVLVGAACWRYCYRKNRS
jgi:hypothetical protein